MLGAARTFSQVDLTVLREQGGKRGLLDEVAGDVVFGCQKVSILLSDDRVGEFAYA